MNFKDDEHSPLDEGTVLVDWYDNDDSDDAEVDEALVGFLYIYA